MILRHPYQKITQLANGQTHVETINEEPTMAQQQYKDECDINNIIKRHSTGLFQELTSRQGQYGDFSKIKHFDEMCNQVLYAKEAFASLPSKIRSRFSNTPGDLLAFIQDPKNYDEALSLGLVNAKEVSAKNDDSTTKNATPPPAQPSKRTKTTIIEDL